MRIPTTLVSVALLTFALAAYGQQQSTPPPSPAQAYPAPSAVPQNRPPSAGHDIGSGAGDIGKGAGGAAGNVAKGTGKGAVDLVTLHPINAVGNVGKGVGVGAKDAGVGAVKGTGKILKGTGKIITHPY
jgi:hypothetical protein